MGIKKRLEWIDGLKFIACFIVFLGHYVSAFSFAIPNETFSQTIWKLFYFIVFGNWWVYVFCIISGYFAAIKHIISGRHLFILIFNRYIRFIFPVFCGNIIVYLISCTFGFHNYELGQVYQSSFLMEPYKNPLTLLGTVKSALLLNNEYIGPLWVLRDIFMGTCFIYVFSYLQRKIYKKVKIWVLIAIGGGQRQLMR